MICIDCDAPCSAKRCDDCATEVAETPNWQQSEWRRSPRLAVEVASPPAVAECAECGVEFEPYRRTQQYCSQRCIGRVYRRRHRETRPTAHCGRCGIALTGHQTKWCSRECYEVARGVRRASPLAPTVCAVPECEVTFTPRREGQRCCSEKHGKLLCNREMRADGRAKAWRIDPEKRRLTLRAKTQRRRALTRGASAPERFADVEIFERDGWRCGICRRKVNRKLRYPHPRSASLDHIVPLSHDPNGHTRANVRCSHLECNVARGNRVGGEQLALVG